MYPEELVAPMRKELTGLGFQELRTPQEVDTILKDEKRTVLVVVNSVCGCAAGRARPAIAMALG
ncbi:MAG: BrxA/BrxB family bacilliredoxin, partial [Candidatus Acidiferrales bacterium]